MFKINKLKQKIELTLEGTESMHGHVFLNSVCPQHHGAERVLDLLATTDSFFPFESEDGTLWIIRRKAVKKIVVDATFELEILRSYGSEALLSKNVKLRFWDGQEAEGQLVIEPREGASRVLDEMNRERGFFIILIGDACHIIGSHYVAMLREI